MNNVSDTTEAWENRELGAAEAHAAVADVTHEVALDAALCVISPARIEAAYWEFDARRKGYAPFKQTPQSERDAFKSAVCRLLAGEPVIP